MHKTDGVVHMHYFTVSNLTKLYTVRKKSQIKNKKCMNKIKEYTSHISRIPNADEDNPHNDETNKMNKIPA
jgi:hypothetical protein